MACIFFLEQLGVNAVISMNEELFWDLGSGVFVICPNRSETLKPSGQPVINNNRGTLLLFY